MGKAERVRNARLAIEEKKQEQRALEQKKARWARRVNISLAAVAAVLLIAFVGGLMFYNRGIETGAFLRRKTALKSEHFSMNAATYTYFFNYQYQSFINNNSTKLKSYGLDVETSLRDQEQSGGKTWFDYFINQTTQNLSELMYLSEMAKAEGMELNEAGKKQLEIFFESLDKTAQEMKMKTKDYIYAAYGQGVSREDIRKGLELSLLATQYYNEKVGAKTYTDAEIEEYYKENINDFRTVNYKQYSFYPSTTDGMTDEQKNAAKQVAADKASRLAKAKTPAEFDRILTAILKEDGSDDEAVKTALSKSLVENSTYDESFEISKWAFGGDARLYATRTYDNGSYVATYMIAALPRRDESETRSVRHILIKSSGEAADAEAKKKAEEILEKFKQNPSTENFSNLALEYSEDPGSAQTGGLYENFTRESMVTAFSDWSFDATRKTGDTGIVKTDYGYHIMCFEGVGQPKWRADVVAAMKNDFYNGLYKQAKDTYKVESDENALQAVPEIRVRSTTTSSAA